MSSHWWALLWVSANHRLIEFWVGGHPPGSLNSSSCVSFQAVFGCYRKKSLLCVFEYLLTRKNNKAYNSGYATLLLLLGIGLYCIIFSFVIMYLILHSTRQLRSAKLLSRGSWVQTVKLWTAVSDKALYDSSKQNLTQGWGLQRYIGWHKVQCTKQTSA